MDLVGVLLPEHSARIRAMCLQERAGKLEGDRDETMLIRWCDLFCVVPLLLIAHSSLHDLLVRCPPDEPCVQCQHIFADSPYMQARRSPPD